MVLLLLPAVARRAPVLVHAPIRVVLYVFLDLPVRTQILVVVEQIGLPSEILPIMSVDTGFFIMVLAPWAPNSLKVEHVEIRVHWVHLVEELDGDFIL